MILLFVDTTYITNDRALNDVSSVANIIIAAISLGLAYYIFIYRKNKDRADDASQNKKEQINKIDAAKLQEQNIRLQWFKELIIQPNLDQINSFYTQLHSLENRIESISLTEEQKIELASFIKTEQSNLRKSFVDVLLGVNPSLYQEVIDNLDNLIDGITNVIFNDGFNLTHKTTFEREIATKISNSRNDLIRMIYNYKGVS